MTVSSGVPVGTGGERDSVLGAIRRGAKAAGSDFSAMVRVASLESGFDADAQATTSSARGVFQFTRGTWLEMVRRHGAEHGLAAEAAALAGGADAKTEARVLALRDDPELSARMAGELTRDNARVIQARTGIKPGASDLYLAHFFGAGGAAQFISAEQAGRGGDPADAMFPRAAAANGAVFYDDGRARSLSEVRAFFERKLAAVDVPATGTRPAESGRNAGTPLQSPAAAPDGAAVDAIAAIRNEVPGPTPAPAAVRSFGWLTPVAGGLISYEARLALAELSAPGDTGDRDDTHERDDMVVRPLHSSPWNSDLG